MKKKLRGFTLIEVVTSFALLMLISSYLLRNMRDNYLMIVKNKEITHEIFDTIKITEEANKDIRDALKKDSALTSIDILKDTPNKQTIKIQTIEMFSKKDKRKIKIFPLNIENHGFTYHTVVGKQEMPEFPAPKVLNLDIFLSDTLDQATYYKNDLIIYSEIDVNKMDDKYKNIFREIKYQWYISSDNFVTKFFPHDDSEDFLFPLFPQNFQIIPNENNPTIDVKEEYKGKQLLLVATPIAITGKMGDAFSSNPIYIDAKPLVGKDIYGHFSMGLMDKNKSSWNDLTKKVANWNSFSGSITTARQHEFEKQPILTKDLAGKIKFNSKLLDVFTYCLRFEENQTLALHDPMSFSDEISVFVVAKNIENATTVIDCEKWELGFDGMTIHTQSGDEKLESPIAKSENFVLLAGRIQKTWKNSYIITYVNNGKQSEMNVSNLLNFDIPDLYIGNHLNQQIVNIAEVLIFKGALPPKDFQSIAVYLINKYGINTN